MTHTHKTFVLASDKHGALQASLHARPALGGGLACTYRAATDGNSKRRLCVPGQLGAWSSVTQRQLARSQQQPNDSQRRADCRLKLVQRKPMRKPGPGCWHCCLEWHGPFLMKMERSTPHLCGCHWRHGLDTAHRAQQGILTLGHLQRHFRRLLLWLAIQNVVRISLFSDSCSAPCGNTVLETLQYPWEQHCTIRTQSKGFHEWRSAKRNFRCIPGHFSNRCQYQPTHHQPPPTALVGPPFCFLEPEAVPRLRQSQLTLTTCYVCYHISRGTIAELDSCKQLHYGGRPLGFQM